MSRSHTAAPARTRPVLVPLSHAFRHVGVGRYVQRLRDITFFNTAAALIPVLLLGGAITERFPRSKDRRGVTAPLQALGVFVFFLLLPALAEMTAIANSLSDSTDRLSVWFVAFAVAFGTWALATSLTWPFLQPLLIGRFRLGLPAMVGLLVVLFTGVLVKSVDLEAVRQEAEASRELLAREEQRYTQALLESNSGSHQSPIFNVDMLRVIDAQEKRLDARLAAGRISPARAAEERLGLAKGRVFITKNMLKRAQ